MDHNVNFCERNFFPISEFQFIYLFIYFLLFFIWVILVFPLPSRCETTPVYRKLFFN